MTDAMPRDADAALHPPPDRALAIAIAPFAKRPALAALFALDQRLGGIVRTTREPLVGQLRLTWWHDVLEALDRDPAPAEPLLRHLQQTLLPLGVTGKALAALIEGWEELIVADPLDIAALSRHAALRGARLFTIGAHILGSDSPVLIAAGQGWALADLAAHLSAPSLAETAAELASEQISEALSGRWPSSLRALGVLILLVDLDRTAGSPLGKALRVARFRLTGR